MGMHHVGTPVVDHSGDLGRRQRVAPVRFSILLDPARRPEPANVDTVDDVETDGTITETGVDRSGHDEYLVTLSLHLLGESPHLERRAAREIGRVVSSDVEDAHGRR